MESLCLQNASLHHPNFGKLPSPISPQPFKNGFSLSLKINLTRPILHAEKHQKLTLGEAPSSRTAKVCCCSIARHSTNGSLTPTVNGSVTDKSLVEAVEKVQDEQALLLQKRASELETDLRGTCIYLIGMMGSGKTTVGKLLAEALGYHFFDSDKLIEEAAGGITVAQFFKQQDEESFRNAETEVLKQLSCNGRLVVATGGGIVVRSVNWSYLRHGVTVWLDVPVEALAERVVAVGTHSRPLLGESNDDSAHSQALARLSSIFEFRAPFYADADVIVSLRKLASRLGYQHVRDLTPAIIAIEVLEEINKSIVRKKHKDAASAV